MSWTANAPPRDESLPQTTTALTHCDSSCNMSDILPCLILPLRPRIMMKLKSIERTSAVEQVVQRITQVIRDQKLGAGARLPGEFELVDQLKVSRPVLREALARLQSMGLVDIQRGRGTFVGSTDSLASCVQLLRTALTITPRELLSYAELRSAIEVQAARQAAERATDDEVADLELLLVELNCEERPYAELLEIDFRFHRKLIDIAGNALMSNLMEVIYEFVLAQMARTTPSPRENKLGRRLHQEIVAALRDRDPDAAERAMREHMQAVLERLKAASREPVRQSKPLYNGAH